MRQDLFELVLFVAGLSFVHFDILNRLVLDGIIGSLFMMIGAITFFLGLYRYNKMKSLIREIKQKESAEGITDEI